MLICLFVIIFTASGFAAEIRRVPGYDKVEQGLMALTLDVEGAENFRYTGLENKMHVYRGKIKPGSKLKFVIKATLGGAKTLPITGRNCTVRLEVIAKKGSEEIKKQSFKSENKSNLFLNYTVPEGADTLEINETFVLNNKSKNREYNKLITERNKLMLTASDAGAAAAVSKTAASGDTKESEGVSTGMLAGMAIAVAAIAGGGYFFMKKRKEDKSANEELARKEKLRQQAIQRQQELQQNLQRRQKEINQHNRMLEEERLREQELARQQEILREQGQQRLMQVQNAMQQAAVAGAAGVMGGVQRNAAENFQQDMSDDAPHFCHNCGLPLKPGDRFCENCGAKV
jgi:hypothetical protein